MNILNLFAGIGGNRALWDDEHTVTAVEIDNDIAEVYHKRFPDDCVVVADALRVLEADYHMYDFIWASPPCQSHGQYRHNVGVLGKGFMPIVPDMTSLYGTIVFLKTYFKGLWCVENVQPYYWPLIHPNSWLGRHTVWCNFSIFSGWHEPSGIRSKNKIGDFKDAELVKNSKIKHKRQVLRNEVEPEIGKIVLDAAMEAFNE